MSRQPSSAAHQSGLFLGLLALAKEIGQTVPDIAPDTAPTGSEAVAIMRDSFGHMFPSLQGSA